jgi:hypothetical protein
VAYNLYNWRTSRVGKLERLLAKHEVNVVVMLWKDVPEEFGA